MQEKNPMPIRKYTLLGIIGLSLIIISLIINLFESNKDFVQYMSFIIQVLGNIVFSI